MFTFYYIFQNLITPRENIHTYLLNVYHFLLINMYILLSCLRQTSGAVYYYTTRRLIILHLT